MSRLAAVALAAAVLLSPRAVAGAPPPTVEKLQFGDDSAAFELPQFDSLDKVETFTGVTDVTFGSTSVGGV